MKKYKRITELVAVFAVIISIIITQTGCERKMEPQSGDGFYLDTLCRITIYAMNNPDEQEAGKLIKEAFDMCGDYEALLSKTKEGSDIYRINHAAGKSVECSPQTIELIEKGIYYGDLSGGKFDITIGKAADLWDFHKQDENISSSDIPSKLALAEAASHVDYKKIKIDGNNVSIDDPESEIDLGGIAKGYIADRIAEFLNEKGVTGAVIDLGGNVTALGWKDGKSVDFRIGVKKPYTESNEVMGSIDVNSKTLVTSGVYERYIEAEGKKYHHVLDPSTGMPVETDLLGVTVIGNSDSSADCDALATVCLLLGKDASLKLMNELKDYRAVFVDMNGDVMPSEGFDGLDPVK